jgi:hypothetical protein
MCDYENANHDMNNMMDPYTGIPEDYYAKYVVKRWNIKTTDVCELFFSITNIKRIQMAIKKRIYEETRGRYKCVVDQKIFKLIDAMGQIYAQYCENRDDKIVHQVKILNKKTLDEIIPDMISSIKQYYGYIHEINNVRDIINDPININRAGRQQLHGSASVLF